MQHLAAADLEDLGVLVVAGLVAHIDLDLEEGDVLELLFCQERRRVGIDVDALSPMDLPE